MAAVIGRLAGRSALEAGRSLHSCITSFASSSLFLRQANETAPVHRYYRSNTANERSLAQPIEEEIDDLDAPLLKLTDGFRRFREETVATNREKYSALAKVQNPKIMIVGCSDSRVDPAVLFGAEPGEIFQVRSVANLVPPYQRDGGVHGTSAALEFAVNYLGVGHIIVLGHQRCGGIQALVKKRLVKRPEKEEPAGPGGFIDSWVKIADQAVEITRLRTQGLSFEEQCEDCEQSSIDVSLRNLMTFPFIEAKVKAGVLKLHGWYYKLDCASLKMWQLSVMKTNYNEIS